MGKFKKILCSLIASALVLTPIAPQAVMAADGDDQETKTTYSVDLEAIDGVTGEAFGNTGTDVPVYELYQGTKIVEGEDNIRTGDKIDGLEAGTQEEEDTHYTLKEKTTPSDYAKEADIEFFIDEENGDVVWASSEEMPKTVSIADKKITITKVYNTAATFKYVDSKTKKDITGATFTLSKDGKKYEEWKTETSAHVINQIPVGKYELKETVAAPGYSGVSRTFEVEIKKTTNDQGVTVEDTTKPIFITKEDENGKVIKGAQIELYDADGKVVASWDSEDSPYEIAGLQDGGKYRIHEKENAPGYVTSKDINIEVKITAQGDMVVIKDGKNLKSDTVNIDYDVTSYEFDIQDSSDNNKRIEGADLEVHKVVGENDETSDESDDMIVDSWTSNDDVHTIQGLDPDGKYYLKETKTAEGKGYVKAKSIPFTVKDSSSTQTIVMHNGLYSFDLKDVTSKESIEGAKLRVVNADDDTVLDSWTSDGAHFVEGLEAEGKYILEEEETAQGHGYVKAEPITFTAKDASKKQSIVMYNSSYSFDVQDIDSKKSIEGAELQVVRNSDNTVLETWSSNGSHFVEGLEAGTEYTFREAKAAEDKGYFKPENDSEIKFTPASDQNGSSIIYNDYTRVSVAKYVEKQNGEIEDIILAGAKLELKKKDGTKTYIIDDTSDLTLLDHVPIGEYTLTEAIPPKGYDYAAPKTVEVKGTNTIQAFELRDSVLPVYIDKKFDKTTVAGASYEILDADGNVVYSWTGSLAAEEIKPGTLKLTDSNHEYIYTLVEKSPAPGYATAEDIYFKITGTGAEATVNGKRVTTPGFEIYKSGKEFVTTGSNTLSVPSDPIKISISKLDAATGSRLVGASMELQDASGKVVKSWTSTEEPEKFDTIPIGLYKLVEKKAPKGYDVAEPQTIEIKDSAEEQAFSIKNYPSDSKISFHKIDAATGDPVEGAKYNIMIGTKVIQTVTTDKDGYAVSAGLDLAYYKDGEFDGYIQYKVIEAEAPEGYFLSGEEKTVTMKTGGIEYDLGEIADIPKNVQGGSTGSKSGAGKATSASGSGSASETATSGNAANGSEKGDVNTGDPASLALLIAGAGAGLTTIGATRRRKQK